MCSTIRNMLREGLKLRVTERTTEEFFEFNANFEGTACSKLYENEASASPRRLRITQLVISSRKILILPFPTNNNDLITDKEKCLVVGLSHSILRIHLKLYVTLLYSWRALKDVDTPFVRTNGLRLLKDNPK
ncbi:hypothetical protein HZH68_008780 [Vespula germanica]|uniref:Uncharacterized protein n=1 Tax=Vespula germanica TaxID=30212 RepID=A0A834JZV7_VESGE|nr:hypothetical protein HZH68_008780 [Vespula germanica]